MKKKKDFNFKNSYTELPKEFYQRIKPVCVKDPKLIKFNSELNNFLNLNLNENDANLGRILSGNILPPGSDPIALAYAGHQFGHFVPQLGDGRAVLLGEVVNNDSQRFDIQLKGSGETKFSRDGDGRSPLGPVIREYIMSEAMFSLNVPTTRSLAMLETGEFVQREKLLPGGILTRVASSHIRFGTFEYFSYKKDLKSLRILTEYSIKRHFSEIIGKEDMILEFLNKVQELSIKLVCKWMSIGFIHGVMNTDNSTISGETIDYGPCAFMDFFDPNKVFSFIDQGGRYSYINQGKIMFWNISKFAETLVPLIDSDKKKATKKVLNILEKYPDYFQENWNENMKRKIGLKVNNNINCKLITDFLEILYLNNVDFTLAFRNLSYLLDKDSFNDKFLTLFKEKRKIRDWVRVWESRLIKEKDNKMKILSDMKQINPFVIPRNHIVEETINKTMNKDYDLLDEFLKVMKNPFSETDKEKFINPPKINEQVQNTFCGT